MSEPNIKRIYKAKVIATVELEVMIKETKVDENIQTKIEDVLRLNDVKDFGNIEEIPTGKYGGTQTDISTLDVGTRFYVHNGAEIGEIVEKDGKKHVLIEGDSLNEAKPMRNDNMLEISILNY